MKIYGLIGKNLMHSYSEDYFNNKFRKEGIKDTAYNLFPLNDVNELKHLIRDNTEICGLNVTIPYKTEAISLLNEMDDASRFIGAVNTLKMKRKNNQILVKGYNTDYIGFADSIKEFNLEAHNAALILGTGGAARAVAYTLDILEIEYMFVSRFKKGKNTFLYSDLNLDILEKFTLVINATPSGMYPNTSQCPDIPYQHLNNNHFLYDLVYNPELTLFLKKGMAQNTRISNGLKMLYAQAEYSWKIWNDEEL